MAATDSIVMLVAHAPEALAMSHFRSCVLCVRVSAHAWVGVRAPSYRCVRAPYGWYVAGSTPLRSPCVAVTSSLAAVKSRTTPGITTSTTLNDPAQAVVAPAAVVPLAALVAPAATEVW